jgi:hypothetical protein
MCGNSRQGLVNARGARAKAMQPFHAVGYEWVISVQQIVDMRRREREAGRRTEGGAFSPGRQTRRSGALPPFGRTLAAMPTVTWQVKSAGPGSLMRPQIW